MQGISAKEHQSILEAFKKYEYLVKIANNNVTADEDVLTREGIEELRKLHSRFRLLLSELDICTQNYEKKRKTVQSVIYKSIRKMNSEMKKKNRYL